MLQIIINYLTILIIPALVGVLARLAFINKRRGYIVSIVFVCIFIVAGLYSLLHHSNGSEGPTLYAFSSLIATAACLVCGVIVRIVKKK